MITLQGLPSMLNRKNFAQLTPIYSMQNPNEPITLYEGSMEIIDARQPAKGVGILKLTWLPFPEIKFEMDITSSSFHPFLMEGLARELSEPNFYYKLELPDFEVHNINVYITRIEPSKAIGWLQKPQAIIKDLGVDLQYVLFHLVNFSSSRIHKILNRNERENSVDIILKSQNWQITIEPLNNLKQLVKELDYFGGYSITHVAKIERCDGKKFSSKEVHQLLEAVFYFLSFARGLWSPPILPVGFDSDGNQAWQEWRLLNVDSWKQVVRAGSSSEHALRFYATFSGFMDKWFHRKSYWRDSLRIAIDWYIQANSTGLNIEASIILVHAGLELLNSICISSEEKSKINKNIRKRINNKDKPSEFQACLQFLIHEKIGVEWEVPIELNKLNDLRENGSTLLTQLRNGLVHRKPNDKNKEKQLSKFSFEARYEVLELSLWYMEVVILYFLGYQENDIKKIVQFIPSLL
jgi:hypothetical protein